MHGSLDKILSTLAKLHLHASDFDIHMLWLWYFPHVFNFAAINRK